MATIQRLEDLQAWQEARKLTDLIYNIVKQFPKTEDYNLTKHLRESSRGTASNIAEGFGRYFYKENLRFYGIARGCLQEVKSDIYISYDAKYINEEIFDKCLKQIKIVESKLNGLIKNVVFQMKQKS